jgi:hypothetical protein
MSANVEDYLYEYDGEGEEDVRDKIAFDCAYSPDTGICYKAGSEECEFECPYRGNIEKSKGIRGDGKHG